MLRAVRPFTPLLLGALVLAMGLVHEEHPLGVGGVIVGWFLLQALRAYAKEEISIYMWWLATKAPIYILCGFAWSAAKLFIFALRSESEILSACNSKNVAAHECIVDALNGPLYWPLMSWITYWPLSMLNSLAFDVLRVVVDVGRYAMQDWYVWIVEQGLAVAGR